MRMRTDITTNICITYTQATRCNQDFDKFFFFLFSLVCFLVCLPIFYAYIQAVMESELKYYSTLTTGSVITINYKGEQHELQV
jgi:hypothetical protein